MSLLETYKSRIKRKKEELIKLDSQKSRYLSDIATKKSKVISAMQSIKRTKVQSTIQSKSREIERYEREIQGAEKNIAEIGKKIAKKKKEINDEEKKLLTEELREEKNRKKELDRQQEKFKREISNLSSVQNNMQYQLNQLKGSKSRITILFLASNPKCEYVDENGIKREQQKLDLDKEAREIREAIVKSIKRDSIDFQTRWATRVSDIFQAINETNPTIIHFSGHGTTEGELVFQDNYDKPKLVSNESIAEMVAASSDDIRMIVFNNCFSSIQAQMIVDKVEAAIGMNTSIGDETAIIFSSQLYSAIGFGVSLEKAFGQAKARLMAEGTYEENTPQLYVKEGFEPKDIVLVK
ncbi:MAG: CHAT domain-containing protein [Clostridia bacterium]